MNGSALSVIIVNYNTPSLTITCVQSMLKFNVANESDIVVVDNASPDNSFDLLCTKLPEINVLSSGYNGGASYGINFGEKKTFGKYLLILNPDTRFVDNSIQKAVTFLDENPDVGLAGLELINPDGLRQFSSRRFYSLMDIIARRTPLGNHWPLKRRIKNHLMTSSWDAGVPFEADWIMGTGFIVRHELFNRIGGMDDTYFLYMEDVDLCARVWLAGYRVMCVPDARLVHDHQRASASGLFNKASRIHLESFFKFTRKYRVPLFRPPSVSTILRA
jgi:GT2 family glycosyltransferase